MNDEATIPERPSDADFAAARKWTSRSAFEISVRDQQRAKSVLRWFLYGPPVAVPENVLRIAREAAGDPGAVRSRRLLAEFILSIAAPPAPEPPKPRAVWQEGTDDQQNTTHVLEVDGKVGVTLRPIYCNDAVWWKCPAWAGGIETRIPDLAAAKRRAEELAGVTTEAEPAADDMAIVTGPGVYLTEHGHLERIGGRDEAGWYRETPGGTKGNERFRDDGLGVSRSNTKIIRRVGDLSLWTDSNWTIYAAEDAASRILAAAEKASAPQLAPIVLPEPERTSGTVIHRWPDTSSVVGFPGGSWRAYRPVTAIGRYRTKEDAAEALRDAGFGPGATTNGGVS